MYKLHVIQKYGGYSSPRPVNSNDLSVWSQVLKLPNTSVELIDKGAPTVVQTAVVSGTKYKFAFKDGTTVIVWRSWTGVISIVKN